jgi:hypothetical protein
MALGLCVRFRDAVTKFAPEKVERSRLHGSKRRSAVDTAGRLCLCASQPADGQVLLRSGMSAQGDFDAHGRHADFRAETAFLLVNTEGVFVLVGVPAPARWLEPNAPPPVDEDADDDELDFEMF